MLLGVYNPPPNIDDSIVQYLQHLAFPPALTDSRSSLLKKDFSITLEGHKHFWKGAKPDTSCYPCALSFATMKVGATNNTIAEVDCLAAQIPLQGGFSPAAWQNAIDVMIPKNQELLFYRD